ncbi:MAG: glycosyltransferase family 2 protein [Acidimicrobiales bacterium]
MTARRALKQIVPPGIRRRGRTVIKTSRDGRFPKLYLSELVREQMEGIEERRLLAIARGPNELCWEADDEPEPLVTVRIATYNRGPMVAERAIASALRQSYERVEVLVIGDHCDEATERAVRAVRDSRVRFFNLPVRGSYPADPMLRWMVAGAAPMNAGLGLAEGKWLAPCDDDDEFTDDHVEVLLAEARSSRLELVWSQAEVEDEQGRWRVLGSEPLAQGEISHGTVLYSSHLRHFSHSITSWKLDEPADWNLWRRMARAGVRTGFLPRVTYRHYREGWARP